MGTHTISVAAGGVTKTVDIQIIQYVNVKIDPVAQGKNSNVVLQLYDASKRQSDSGVIGIVEFSQADEPISFLELSDYESDVNSSRLLSWKSTGSGFAVSAQSNWWDSFDNTLSIPEGKHTFTIKGIKVIGGNSGVQRTVSGLPITFTYDVVGVPNPEIIPTKTTHTHNVMNESSFPPLDPGIVGSFNIKYVTNRCVEIESYTLRIENETKNSFSGGIGNGGSKCVVGGDNKSSDTDGNGVTKIPFNLTVSNLLMDGITNRSWNYRATNPPISIGKAKFYIENMRVKDQATGLVKDISSPTVFELEIVMPYY